MKRKETLILKLFALWLSCLLVVFSVAYAKVEITVSKASDVRTPIVIMPISGGASGIIEADLKRSGRFSIVRHGSLPAISPFGGSVNTAQFNDKVDYIVRGKPEGKNLKIELISISNGRNTQFTISPNRNQRRQAHKAADAIYEKITRRKGAFDTLLAYVAVTNPVSDNRKYWLYIAESDGHNAGNVLESTAPIISPTWSPDGSHLAYVSYQNDRPEIFVLDLFSGEYKAISRRQGLNGAPAWSPDGKKLAFTLSTYGNSDIFTIDIGSGIIKRITMSSALDTEPSWHGNQQIIFTSDRGGRPQLYQIAATGGKARRLTFSGDYNSNPDVKNNRMTFIKGNGNQSSIVLSNADGSNEKLLSRGALDESPSISPNGAMVAYVASHNGKNTLAVVSDNGKEKQFLKAAPGNIKEVAWSPYIR